jgi:hypothetical protein
MNKHIRRVVGSIVFSALAPISAFAAGDAFIKISDIKGESRVVACPAGDCVVTGLAVGSYQVQVCDEKGAPVDAEGIDLTQAIVGLRDASTGMPTGRRMHKPMTLTKDIDKSSPKLYGLVITEAGSQVSIKAQDYNSSRSNRTTR